MPPHYSPFFRSERARLAQDGVGHADLADIVHGAGIHNALRVFRAPPEVLGDQPAIMRHAAQMRRRLVIFEARGPQQPQQCSAMRLLQFAAAVLLGHEGALQVAKRLDCARIPPLSF